MPRLCQKIFTMEQERRYSQELAVTYIEEICDAFSSRYESVNHSDNDYEDTTESQRPISMKSLFGDRYSELSDVFSDLTNGANFALLFSCAGIQFHGEKRYRTMSIMNRKDFDENIRMSTTVREQWCARLTDYNTTNREKNIPLVTNNNNNTNTTLSTTSSNQTSTNKRKSATQFLKPIEQLGRSRKQVCKQTQSSNGEQITKFEFGWAQRTSLKHPPLSAQLQELIIWAWDQGEKKKFKHTGTTIMDLMRMFGTTEGLSKYSGDPVWEEAYESNDEVPAFTFAEIPEEWRIKRYISSLSQKKKEFRTRCLQR